MHLAQLKEGDLFVLLVHGVASLICALKLRLRFSPEGCGFKLGCRSSGGQCIT